MNCNKLIINQQKVMNYNKLIINQHKVMNYNKLIINQHKVNRLFIKKNQTIEAISTTATFLGQIYVNQISVDVVMI